MKTATLDTEIEKASRTKRSKKQKEKNVQYWTKFHEDCVKQYLEMPEGVAADRFFEENLYPVLRKLVENIMFRYKLNCPDLHPDEQIRDVLSFVVSKFRKFDPSKGHKAFSYYGTVAKNYMIINQNKKYSNSIHLLDIDSFDGNEEDNSLSVEAEYSKNQETKEFYLYVIASSMKEIIESDLSISPNAYKLAEVIIYLLNNSQQIRIYSKNQFYFLAKEMTGLSTKQIAKALIEIKAMYERIKSNEFR